MPTARDFVLAQFSKRDRSNKFPAEVQVRFFEITSDLAWINIETKLRDITRIPDVIDQRYREVNFQSHLRKFTNLLIDELVIFYRAGEFPANTQIILTVMKRQKAAVRVRQVCENYGAAPCIVD